MNTKNYSRVALIIAGTLLLAGEAGATACKPTDFNGNWTFYIANITQQETGRCELAVSKNTASGNCSMSNGWDFDLAGPFTISKTCDVTMKLDYDQGYSNFDVHLDSSKKAFVGQWKNNADMVGTSSGVKN